MWREKQGRAKIDEGGPSEVETQAAIEELKKELESPEMVDAITVESVPPEQVIEESNKRLVETVTEREETFKANIDELTVKGYLDSDMSPNDPYIMVDSADSRMTSGRQYGASSLVTVGRRRRRAELFMALHLRRHRRVASEAESRTARPKYHQNIKRQASTNTLRGRNGSG